jgi:hypothetical protein
LLKISAKIFDPLGLLSPFTIQWKVLFQLLCNENIEWDDELSGEHLKKMELYRSMEKRIFVEHPRIIKSTEQQF